MAAGDIYHLTCVANLDKVAIANIFYIKVLDDDTNPGDVEELNTQFVGQILAELTPLQSDTVEYECNLIRKLLPTSDPAIMFPLDTAGELGSDSLPSNLTMCLNTWSSDGRPPFRGRWFFSGLLEASVSDGRFTQATATSWSTFLSAISDSYGTVGNSYRLMHHSPAQEEFNEIKRGRLAAIPRKLRNRTPGLCSIS